MPRRREPARPWTRRSVSSARFGSPVSESCSAWWASSCSICLRSVMSWSWVKKYCGLARLVAHERDVRRRPHDRAVRPQVAPLVLVGVVARGHPRSARPVRAAPRRGGVNSVQRRPTSCSVGPAEERAQRRVHPRRDAVEIGDDGADRRLLEADLEAGLGRAAHAVGLDPLGVVHHRADDLDDGAVRRRPPGRPAEPHVAHAPVGADDAELEIERRARARSRRSMRWRRPAPGRRDAPSRRTARAVGCDVGSTPRIR